MSDPSPGHASRAGPGPSSFVRQVLTLVTGTAFAQLIPLAVSPALARLYPPAEFGVYGLYVSLVVVLGALAGGRYELAVMLPARDSEAIGTVRLTWLLAVATGAILGAAFWAFRSPLASLLGVPGSGSWLPLVPVAASMTSGIQALITWGNRRQRYRHLALAAVLQQTAAVGTSLTLGRLGWTGSGMIAGAIAGQVVALVPLAATLFRGGGSAPAEERVPLRTLARTYRKFPLVNVPYSMLVALSARSPILLFNAFGFAAIAGYFSFSRSVILAPLTLIAAGLGQVFFREAASAWGTPRVEARLHVLMRLACACAPPFYCLLAIWAPELFEFVFGASWKNGGHYARALAPMAFLALFTSWPERIFELARRQELALLVQAVWDAVNLSLIWILLGAGVDPLACAWVYSGVSCLYHASYLVALFKVGGFSLKRLLGHLGFAAGLIGVFGAAFAAIRLYLPGPALQMACAGTVIGVYLVGLAWRRLAGPSLPLPETSTPDAKA